jgi:sugar phosphate isomerase/epimerase
MTTRRDFLTRAALGAGAAAWGASRAWPDATAASAVQAALGAPVGLQLWSLRAYLPDDLAGTLGKVRAMGFTEVEGAGLWHHTKQELRAAMDAAGLRCRSAHLGFERLRDDPSGGFAEARALGADTVVCPWIPHADEGFTAPDAARAAAAFDLFGRQAAEEGLAFSYHCHGYEFVPSADGTLFDTLAKTTDPARVSFQIDVFHAYLGGADPVSLIAGLGSRVRSLHLKDLKKGFPVKVGTAVAPPEADVPVGTGQIDYPAVLRAARAAKVPVYYLEDESADPLGHIPQSLRYLAEVKP